MKVRWTLCGDGNAVLLNERDVEVAFAAADGSYSVGAAVDGECHASLAYSHSQYSDAQLMCAKAAAMARLDERGVKLELADD